MDGCHVFLVAPAVPEAPPSPPRGHPGSPSPVQRGLRSDMLGPPGHWTALPQSPISPQLPPLPYAPCRKKLANRGSKQVSLFLGAPGSPGAWEECRQGGLGIKVWRSIWKQGNRGGRDPRTPAGRRKWSQQSEGQVCPILVWPWAQGTLHFLLGERGTSPPRWTTGRSPGGSQRPHGFLVTSQGQQRLLLPHPGGCGDLGKYLSPLGLRILRADTVSIRCVPQGMVGGLPEATRVSG